MKKINKQSGITLVALVITIIILLLLAGIVITQLTGDNGLFIRAKQAKNNTLDAQNTENIAIADYESKIEEIVNGNRGNLKEQTPGTATAEDIAEGKTAWVNGEKITGTRKEDNYELLSFSNSIGTGHGITDFTNEVLDTIGDKKTIEIVCSGAVGTYVQYHLMINGTTIDTIIDEEKHVYNLKDYPSSADVKIRITTNATFVGAGYAIKINK